MSMSMASAIHELILSRAAGYGSIPAFRHVAGGHVFEVSYGEVARATAKAATWLRTAGLGQGDLLALSGNNSPLLALSFLGAARLGARVAFVPITSSPDDLAQTLADIKPKVFCAEQTELATLPATAKKITTLNLEEIMLPLQTSGTLTFPMLPLEQAILVRTGTNSSGTKTKSTAVGHARLIADVKTVGKRFSMRPGDRILSLVPLSDHFGLIAGLLAPLAYGGTVVSGKPRSAEHLQEIIRLEKVCTLVAATPVLEELLDWQSCQTDSNSLPDRLAVALARNAVIGAGKHGPALAQALLYGIRRRLGGQLTTLIANSTGVSGDLDRAANSYGLTLLDRSMFPGAGSPSARPQDNGSIWWEPQDFQTRPKRKGSAQAKASGEYQFLGSTSFGNKAPWPSGARFGTRISLQDAPLVVASRRSLVVAARTFLKIYNDMHAYGAERLVIDPPFIVACNYDSHLNALAVLSCFPTALVRHVHPVAPVDTFFGNEVASLASASLLNAVPYDRFIDDEEGMRHCMEFLRRAEILIQFPEGSLSTTGELGPFNDTVATLAITTGCPIIPAYVHGMRDVLPQAHVLPHPAEVSVRFGLPIYPGPAPAELSNTRALTRRLREALEDLSGLEHKLKSRV